MGTYRRRKTMLGLTTAIALSAFAFPAAASTNYSNTDESMTAVCSDDTYAMGLNVEAQIISTIEQDQRSPYANKGIAVTGDYVAVRKSADSSAGMVGKLYNGSGCEILETKDGWTHIRSGKVEGYVQSSSLMTGVEAQEYAQENNISSLVAKAVDEEQSAVLRQEPSADAKVLKNISWDEEVKVVGESSDKQWTKVSVGGTDGYIPSDSVIIDAKYEEAAAVKEETQAKTETQKETQAPETEAQKETQAPETEAQKETKAAETETVQKETQAPETEAETKKSEPQTQAQTKESEAAQPAAAEKKVSISSAQADVWATYTVSIRSSYSTGSSRLGLLYAGNSIHRTGTTDNGWSQVEYNGQKAYIKSEYLTTQKPASAAAGTTAAADLNEKVYAATAVRVRSSASTGASVLGTLYAGQAVTRHSNTGGWSQVDYNGKKGYVSSQYLTKTAPAAANTQKSQTSSASTQKSQSSASSITEVNETVYATYGVNVRSGAGTSYSVVSSMAAGSSATRTGKTASGWSRVKVNGVTGYVKSDYLTTTKPKVQAASSTTASSTSTEKTSSSNSSLGQQIASFALQYVGYPYVYGGNSLTSGVDCSGFTQQVYLHFGYSLPRRASIQATVGTSVSISNLQPGDLVFYGDSSGVGHVTIYIGGGQVVHASTPSKGIIVSDMYYRTPLCAKRII